MLLDLGDRQFVDTAAIHQKEGFYSR